MGLKNTTDGWGILARAFHWVMAIGIFGSLAIGLYMTEVLGNSDRLEAIGERIELTQLHKSFGFVLFCLALGRLAWRWANPTPPLPDGMPWYERIAAKGGHLALYVLMIAMPISGWLMATSSPLNDAGAYPMQIENMVFGLFHMPDPYPTGDRALSELFGAIHGACAWALLALLALHAGAALKHHFVNRDTVLRRMIVGR